LEQLDHKGRLGYKVLLAQAQLGRQEILVPKVQLA
jgi:hypothetical protein